jgi:hypothetical protein
MHKHSTGALKQVSYAKWRRQVPIDLYVNGKRVFTYPIDFVAVDCDGKVMLAASRRGRPCSGRPYRVAIN